MRRTCSIVAVLLWCCVWASAQDQPKPEASSECDGDQACSTDKGCVAGKCVDLCVGKPCGTNALCQVHDHHASCVCKDGHLGDPIEACFKQVECESDEQCGAGKACVNSSCVAKECVGKICAPEASCVLEDGVATCVCRLGLVGYGDQECEEPSSINKIGFSPAKLGARRNTELCRGNRFPKPLGKKVFHVVTSFKTNWYNAYMYCVSHGHRLATVESKKENEMILEAIRETNIHNDIFFVAGNDHAMEEKWFWMTTGLPVKFTYWHAGRPSCSDSLNCMAYSESDYPAGTVGYRWYDKLCNTELNYFICEDYV